jgi:hypothetical protein
VVRCGFKEVIPNRHVFERDWTACPKYVNHSRLNKLGETTRIFNEHKDLLFDYA